MKNEHQESASGMRLTDFKIQEKQRSKYFSGQGRVMVAKRDAYGVPGEFCFLGNVPKLSVFSSGRIEIVPEAWQIETWPLLFGGDGTETVSDGKTFREFTFNPNGNSGEYYLLLEGVNSADGNKSIRLEIFRVTFEAASRIDFISDEIAEFPIVGMFHLDEVRKGYGTIRVQV